MMTKVLKAMIDLRAELRWRGGVILLSVISDLRSGASLRHSLQVKYADGDIRGMAAGSDQ